MNFPLLSLVLHSREEKCGTFKYRKQSCSWKLFEYCFPSRPSKICSLHALEVLWMFYFQLICITIHAILKDRVYPSIKFQSLQNNCDRKIKSSCTSRKSESYHAVLQMWHKYNRSKQCMKNKIIVVIIYKIFKMQKKNSYSSTHVTFALLYNSRNKWSKKSGSSPVFKQKKNHRK